MNVSAEQVTMVMKRIVYAGRPLRACYQQPAFQLAAVQGNLTHGWKHFFVPMLSPHHFRNLLAATGKPL